MVKKRASGGCSADKALQRRRGIQPLCSLQRVFCALFPGAALNAPCPGYRFTAVRDPVARADAQHRLRGIQPLCSLQGVFCALLPGAALNAPCPGYRFIAVCSVVARTDAQHRLRGIQPLCSLQGVICAMLPGGGAQRALPGLQVHRRLQCGSPDRCTASPPGNSTTLFSARGILRTFPGGGA